MLSLKNPLIVPIRLDARVVGANDTSAVPAADFTQLGLAVPASPASGMQVAAQQPWLGDTVHLDAANTHPLPAGVHLHWTLPKALRHGRVVYRLDKAAINELTRQGLVSYDNDNPAPPGVKHYVSPGFINVLSDASLSEEMSYEAFVGKLKALGGKQDERALTIWGPAIAKAAARTQLPVVPNRWLVVRVDASEYTAWIVESDRLTSPATPWGAPGTPTEGAGPTAVPGPMPGPADGTRSYQYLGFKSVASSWSEDSTLLRLTPLTAAGYGYPSFASSYIDCRGVFGLHDPLDGVAKDTTLTYVVIGWFSDPTQDAILDGQGSMPSGILEKLGWCLADGTTAGDIDGSVYSGSVIGVKTRDVSTPPTASNVKVAVGNTAAEALSALLAGTDSTTLQGLGAEAILNAAQAGELHQALHPDGPALVARALHDRAFQHEEGGCIWQITRPPATGGLQKVLPSGGEISLPGPVAEALDALNQAQMAFDRAQAMLLSQRRQLFTDVCRWLRLQTTDNPGIHDPKGLGLGVVGAMTDSLDVASGKELPSNANTTAPDQATGPGGLDSTASVMPLAYGTLWEAHDSLSSAISALPSTTTTDWRLQPVPAPRYHRPADPVVLLSDSSGNAGDDSPLVSIPADTLTEGGGNLTCRVTSGLSSEKGLKATPLPCLPANWAGADAVTLIEELVDEAAKASPNWQNPWRPVMLGWEARVLPLVYCQDAATGADTSQTGSTQLGTYHKGFITGACSLGDAGVDLSYSTPAAPSFFEKAQDAIYNGRVSLSSRALSPLKDRIARLAGLPDGSAAWNAKALPVGLEPAVGLLKSAYESGASTLSQCLHGFHDRLLMLRRTIQLDVYNPGNNTSLSQYHASGHVGRQALASPDMMNIYSPVRSGYAALTSLFIVDSFGQKIDLPAVVRTPSPVTTFAASLRGGSSVPAGYITMPPRLCQASRLLFRWLSAVDPKVLDDVESNALPASSPVCGWLVLNRLDESIMLFNPGGDYAGSVSASDGTYVPPPGVAAGTTPKALLTDPFAILVAGFLTTPGNASQAFEDISGELLTIEPRAHRECTGLSALVSRPLALVRAALRLELQGSPSPHQGYGWLTRGDSTQPVTDPLNITSQAVPGFTPFLPRDTKGFPDVQFPIYLGDAGMDDDGLVLYFPVSTPSTAPSIGSNYYTASVDQPVPLSCGDPAPTEVLLLVDPRAPIHAISGILPAKRLTIPGSLYAAAVQRMQLLFGVGPVITPAASPKMPLPAETRAAWQWMPAGAGQTPVAVSGKADDRAHLTAAPPVLRSGWLAAKPYADSAAAH